MAAWRCCGGGGRTVGFMVGSGRRLWWGPGELGRGRRVGDCPGVWEFHGGKRVGFVVGSEGTWWGWWWGLGELGGEEGSGLWWSLGEPGLKVWLLVWMSYGKCQIL